MAPPALPRLLQGGPIGAEIRASVTEDVAAFRQSYGYVPGLAIVIVGRDAPSAVYLQQILRSCAKVGIEGRLVEIEGEVSAARLHRQIVELNEDPLVSGIIVQMPLPAGLPLATVLDALDPDKDIDGIHPRNAGLMTLGYEGFLPTTAHAAVSSSSGRASRSRASGRSWSVGRMSSANPRRSSCFGRTRR